ncbi:ATP-binding protein [Mucilaginibacter gilvus]|uniref:histidine kinase n=1 Tax=Mucilaginibacter gilvus TaxID=2305909 RepID=A0A3S3URZ2_9SPHI|nr:ATP-binding protein [Mucilaginibacter gilvus]RWY49282.1 PAS domain S-box protein [Mucilaginibacter gilvus]
MNSSSRFSSDELLEILSLSHNATAIHSTMALTVQTANDAMLAIWGKDRSVIGLPLEEALPELKGQPFIGMMQAVLNTGITHEDVNTPADLVVNGKLQTFYFDFSYRAIKNAQGETYCLLHTATDVTDRYLKHQALLSAQKTEAALAREQSLNEELATTIEELSATNKELKDTQQKLEQLNTELEDRVARRTMALSKSEANFRNMILQAPVAIGLFKGYDMVLDMINDKFLQLWGRDKSVLGKRLEDALPELRDQPFIKIMQGVYATDVPYFGNEAKVMLERNGRMEEGFYNFINHPFKDAEGNTTGIIVVATDVTEQVQARKELEKAEEKTRFALEAANVGTWFLDVETREFVVSARLKEQFGYYADEEVTYEMAAAAIPDEYKEKVMKAVEKAITTGRDYVMEHPVIGHHDQKKRWVRAYGKLYPDDSGKLSHFSGLIIDITEQKQDEMRKNDFIGMVSHELKTPLTSLSAYAQMLYNKARNNDDGFTLGALEKVNTQVKKMSTMINGFLNVSRLESGRIFLNKHDFALDELVAEMIDDARLTIASHNINFTHSEPLMLNADRDKIGSVISNLLSNAVKYSPRGKNIQVECRLINNMAQISVKDEGMGVKPQDIEKIFDRYYRVESSHTQTVSGFGIGLYLCAEIVHRHDGKIGVESQKAEGSTFYFTLPVN